MSRKDRVIATARSVDSIMDLESEDCLILALDVADSLDNIKSVVDRAEKAFGPIDIVVNNAGFGLLGMSEEVG